MTVRIFEIIVLLCPILAILGTPVASLGSENYLSDKNPSYAVIEYIQKGKCKDKKGASCQYDKDSCVETVVDLHMEMFQEAPSESLLEVQCSQVSTRYEFPGTHTLLLGLFDQIYNHAASVGLKKVDNLHFGSLALKQVNARVLPPDEGYGQLILFDHQFFIFANEMAKIASLTIPFEVEQDGYVINLSEDDSIEMYSKNGELQSLFWNRIVYFLGFEPLKPYPPTKEIRPILLRYQEGVELFAMAHEYAHAALDHSALTVTNFAEADNGELYINSPKGDWVQELEADHYALRLLKEIASRRIESKKNHVTDNLLFYTPAFYFLSRVLVEEANSVFNEGVLPKTASKEEYALLEIAQDCAARVGCDIPTTLIDSKVPIPEGHPNNRIRLLYAIAFMESVSLDEEGSTMSMLSTAMLEHMNGIWASTRAKLLSEEGQQFLKQILNQDGANN